MNSVHLSVVWSVALHGPTDVLVQRLRPLLMQYDVTAYFCGHDHNTQHIREENSTVEYVLTGAAHMTGISVEHAVSSDTIIWTKLACYKSENIHVSDLLCVVHLTNLKINLKEILFTVY